MAKTTDTPETSIVLEDYVPAPAPGKYDDYVLAMLEADAKIQAEDPDGFTAGRRKKATVPSESRMGKRKVTQKDGSIEEVDVDLEVEKTIRLFQESARNHDRTAKVVGRAPQGDGNVLLSFVLGPKQRRPRTGTAAATTPDSTPEASQGE